MERIELKSQTRTIQGKKVKQLRAKGWVPAVLFGSDMPSKSIQLEETTLVKALRHAGMTSLIDLFLDDESKSYLVLAREIQRDILTSRLQHVDFYQVRLDQKIRTMPSLLVEGVSPAVESGMAIMVQILNQIEVECLPTDLIDSITVDISGLETLDDSISISDLSVPSGVTILADPGDTIISLVSPRIVEEVEEEEEEEVGEFEEGEEVDVEGEPEPDTED